MVAQLVQQPTAQPLLQLSDHLGGRGLANAKIVGCLGK
jgi:hypothetical protein